MQVTLRIRFGTARSRMTVWWMGVKELLREKLVSPSIASHAFAVMVATK